MTTFILARWGWYKTRLEVAFLGVSCLYEHKLIVSNAWLSWNEWRQRVDHHCVIYTMLTYLSRKRNLLQGSSSDLDSKALLCLTLCLEYERHTRSVRNTSCPLLTEHLRNNQETADPVRELWESWDECWDIAQSSFFPNALTSSLLLHFSIGNGLSLFQVDKTH